MRRVLSRLRKLRAALRSPPGNAFTNDFIARAKGKEADTEELRRKLANQFDRIHREVLCAHQQGEALLLAEAILDLQVEGPIVELGCFKGGTTAKLSLVARATHRSLYVCDSFAGLPSPKTFDETHHFLSGRVKHYHKGDYIATVDEVTDNVTALGSIEVCKFVKGYFAETLPGLEVEPALVFMDVDLIESARDCMRHLWPRLRQGGKFFTHEAGVCTFIRGLLEPAWWHQNTGSCPPILLGAGYGFGPDAANLAYFEKSGGGKNSTGRGQADRADTSGR